MGETEVDTALPEEAAETVVDLAHTRRQPANPLHGITLEMMLRALVKHYDWPGLAQRIAVRCFAENPSMGSSLKFLRKTPWARGKVEGLYEFMLRERAREGRRPGPRSGAVLHPQAGEPGADSSTHSGNS